MHREKVRRVQIVDEARLDVLLGQSLSPSDSREYELRELLKMVDAFRVGNTREFVDLGYNLIEKNKSPSDTDEVLDEEWRVILNDPLKFVMARLSYLASSSQVVLWQAAKKRAVAVGILCSSTLDALCVLAIFHLQDGIASRTGNCLICGDKFRRRRGERRQTCTDSCRKRLARARSKAINVQNTPPPGRHIST